MKMIMSNSYRPSKPINSAELFNGRLYKYGIREQFKTDTNSNNRYLIDSNENVLMVKIFNEKLQSMNIGDDTAWIILSAIADEFDCDIQPDGDSNKL
jgi:hypothetical protein